MTPTLVLIGLLLLGAMILCSAGLIVLALIGAWREQRYWRRHADRLAAYHEAMAADNGRPHGGVLQRATRRES
jgi:hypothetical protein